MAIIEKITIPRDSVNDEQVVIKQVHVINNQAVQPDTLLIDYETSKANFELYPTKEGFCHLSCENDDYVNIGDVVVEIHDNPVVNDEQEDDKKVNTSPSFSKKALEKIKILNLDKKVFLEKSNVTEKMVVDYYNKQNNDLEMKISLTKKNEIMNLTNTGRFGLTSSVEKYFDTSSLETEDIYLNKEFKGSINIILIKAISELLSLNKYRHLNSYVDQNKIKIYKAINFGIAINIGDGLKVGVIKESDKKSVHKIESEILGLIDKYIDRKMGLDDVTGSTVAMTDLTDEKIDRFNPLIINKHAIMIGLCGIKNETQKIIISFDHRISDGLEIARFLNDILSKINSFSK